MIFKRYAIEWLANSSIELSVDKESISVVGFQSNTNQVDKSKIQDIEYYVPIVYY